MPANGKPISDANHWPNQHNALLDVNEGVKRVARELQILALLRKGEQQNWTDPCAEILTIYEEAIALAEQHKEEALVSPKILARLHQGKGRALFGLSRAQERALPTSDKQQALEAFEHALRYDETLVYSYEQKGTLLYEFGRYEEALTAINEAIERSEQDRSLPPLLSLCLTKYEVLLQLKRINEALAFYEQNLTNVHSTIPIHRQAAGFFEQERQYERALAACERAIVDLPAPVLPPYESKARLLECLERYEEALAVLLEYEQKNTLQEGEEGFFYLNKGLLLEILRRDEEALAAFDKAIPLGQAHFGRQRIHERLAWQASEMATFQGYTGRFRPVHVWQGHSTIVYCLACSPTGQFFASGGEDGAIKLWDLSSGKKLRALHGHRELVESIAFSPEGGYLVSGSTDCTIRLWIPASGDETIKFQNKTSIDKVGRRGGPQTADVSSVAFSPDGCVLASGDVNGIIRLWDPSARKELLAWYVADHYPAVHTITFSPDGRSLASGSADGIVRLWNPVTGAELLTLYGHTQSIWSVAFSPDGHFLASGSADHTIHIWDLCIRQQPPVLSKHTGIIESVAFSPDGRFLVSGSADGSIKCCDFASGKEIQTLDHGSAVYSLALSPDGYTLVSGGKGGTLKLWRLQ